MIGNEIELELVEEPDGTCSIYSDDGDLVAKVRGNLVYGIRAVEMARVFRDAWNDRARTEDGRDMG